MSYTAINATGVTLGSSGQQQVKIVSNAANVLQLQGTDSNVLAKVRGLADPSDDTDATSRSYVQTYVSTALRGLQMKMSVRLASLTNVNLSGGGLENSTTVLRWSSAADQANLLSVLDSFGRSIVPSNYPLSGNWTFAYKFNGGNFDGFFSSEIYLRFNENGSRTAGPNFFPRSGTPGQGIMHPDLSSQIEACSGGWAQLPGNPGRMIFPTTAFQYTDDVYFHFTWLASEQKCTMSIAKMVNGSLQLVPTAGPFLSYRNTNPGYSTYDEGLYIGEVSNLLYDIHVNRASPAVFSDVLLANKIMTLQEVFGPAPAGWTTTGIDGVIPSANDRVLLTAQTDPKQNGLWQVSTDGTALQRPADFAVGSHAASAYCFVTGSGLSNDNKGFLCTSDGPADVVGTDNLTWQIYTASGGLGGLSVNGSTISTSSPNVTFANNVVAPELITGTLTVQPAHISDSSGTLTFTNTNIVAPSVVSGSLSMSSGSLTDSSGQITLGSTNLSTTGQVQASTFVSPSDEPLKHDIEDATIVEDHASHYEELYALQPRSFKWPDGREDIGLIAQEVQETLQGYRDLASLVSPINDNSSVYLGVDYSKLSVLTLMMAKHNYSLISPVSASVGARPAVGTPKAGADDLWNLVHGLYNYIRQLRALLRIVVLPAQLADLPQWNGGPDFTT
jgi:hypothetical protein